MSTGPVFDKFLSLSYLGFPEDYEPSPQTATIPFLIKHLAQLPPHLLLHFSYITSAKDRTVIPTIRNRRLKYANSTPPELQFAAARNDWPNLWQGRERRGMEEGAEEKAWADKDFLGGSRKHVGNLGGLLGEYEEEREAERVRTLRRERAVVAQFIPEEDDDSNEDDTDELPIDEDTPEEARASFERLIRERFIYGILEASLYSC